MLYDLTNLVLLFVFRSLNAAGEQSSIDNPVKICPLRDFAPAEPGFSSLQSSINQSQDSIRAVNITISKLLNSLSVIIFYNLGPLPQFP